MSRRRSAASRLCDWQLDVTRMQVRTRGSGLQREAGRRCGPQPGRDSPHRSLRARAGGKARARHDAGGIHRVEEDARLGLSASDPCDDGRRIGDGGLGLLHLLWPEHHPQGFRAAAEGGAARAPGDAHVVLRRTRGIPVSGEGTDRRPQARRTGASRLQRVRDDVPAVSRQGSDMPQTAT